MPEFALPITFGSKIVDGSEETCFTKKFRGASSLVRQRIQLFCHLGLLGSRCSRFCRWSSTFGGSGGHRRWCNGRVSCSNGSILNSFCLNLCLGESLLQCFGSGLSFRLLLDCACLEFLAWESNICFSDCDVLLQGG